MIRRRRRPTRDDRLDAELRDHLERFVADRVARGIPEIDARRQAHVELGGLEQTKETCRDVRRFHWLHEFLRDLRLGFRALGRERLFAVAVTVILALGIGLSVAMFSVLHAVVLRPLPYAVPAELAFVSTHLIAQNRPDGTALANLRDWRERSRTFADLTFYRRPAVTIVTFAGLDEPQRGQEGLVGPNFFALLGTPPLLGRVISADEFERRERVVVLSERLWRERFAGAGSAIGQTLLVDGHDHLVVGVMPRTFQLPTRDTRLWRPLSLIQQWPRILSVRDGDQFEVLGRLRPGTAFEDAAAEMRAIAAGLRTEYHVNQNLDIRVTPLSDHVVGRRARRGLWLGFGAVLCLLAIACANVGGLLIARAARRRRELAVRMALGAGRARVFRQLLAEAIALWAVASAGGALLAHALARLIAAYGPRALPRLDDVGLDAIALGAAFAGGLVVVIACATLPAAVASNTDATAAFGARDESNLPRGRLHDVLITGQIGGTVVLLVTAVLFVQSFLRAQREDPGYPAENLLIVRLDLPGAHYPDRAAVSTFLHRITERLHGVPGVVAVGGITDFFIRRNADQWVTIKGQPAGRPLESPRLAIEGVTPGFFPAAGIPLVEGRDFTEADYAPGAAPVYIVNESLARRFWPGESAIGKQIVSGEAPPKDGHWRTVVGVVRDIRREGRDLEPILGAFNPSLPRVMDLTIRASTRIEPLIPAVRKEIRSLDPLLPLTEALTADGRLSERLGGRRFEGQVLAGFSAVALLLSATGLYALLAYQVALRKREIGIRSALGANRLTIVRLFVGKGLRLAVLGAMLGVSVAAAGMRVLQSLLYETAALNAGSYAAALACVLVVATVAAGLPALRAARISPMSALRE